jgi:hypothetical protein
MLWRQLVPISISSVVMVPVKSSEVPAEASKNELPDCNVQIVAAFALSDISNTKPTIKDLPIAATDKKFDAMKRSNDISLSYIQAQARIS